MAYVCGFALGDVPAALADDLMITLPQSHLPGWSVRGVAETTDRLLDLTKHYEQAPWTTLCVTPWLSGGTSLEKTLVALKRAWPSLRIAIIFGDETPQYQKMISTLAQWQIFNCLVGSFEYEDVVSLITTDYAWEDIQKYLVMPGELGAPPEDTLPRRVSSSTVVESTYIGPSQTVAVVSAQGRSGKTGMVASLLWASAGEGSMALDLDIGKPALPLYFRAADDPYPLQLQHLLAGLSPQTEQLTPQDKHEIREYLGQAVEVTPGARLAPGPLRHHAMTPAVPGKVASAMIAEAKKMARWIWVDTPVPQDALWEDIVRTVDRVIVVSPTDTVGILETLALYERLARLRVPPQAISLVVNPMSKGGRPPEEVARVHLHQTTWATCQDYTRRWETILAAHRPAAAFDPKWWQRFIAQFAAELDGGKSGEKKTG